MSYWSLNSRNQVRSRIIAQTRILCIGRLFQKFDIVLEVWMSFMAEDVRALWVMILLLRYYIVLLSFIEMWILLK